MVLFSHTTAAANGVSFDLFGSSSVYSRNLGRCTSRTLSNPLGLAAIWIDGDFENFENFEI
jgi:hypothetical protein